MDCRSTIPAIDQMRLYHFLPAQHALDDLTKGRLKLSEKEPSHDRGLFALDNVCVIGR